MKSIEKLTVEYIGYKNPDTKDEVQMEILGLEAAICGINHRIATLRQGVQLNNIMKLSDEEKSNAETVVSPEIDLSKAEQKSEA